MCFVKCLEYLLAEYEEAAGCHSKQDVFAVVIVQYFANHSSCHLANNLSCGN